MGTLRVLQWCSRGSLATIAPIDRYLEAAHLVILAGSSLFVHGGITARSAGLLPHAADTDPRLPVTDWVLY